LTLKSVFTTISLLNVVQFILTKNMTTAVQGLSECCVSCQRIQAFFELSEQQQQQQHPVDHSTLDARDDNEDDDNNDDNDDYNLKPKATLLIRCYLPLE